MFHSRRAVFLDRDGTLNRDVGYAHRADQLELLPGVAPGLRALAQAGFRLVIATNQSGIGRGYFTEAQMHAFHRTLVARLADEGVEITAIYYCPYHPTAGIGPYRRESYLRKPSPGMLRQAAADLALDLPACFAVGDRLTDVMAGRAAGCRTILLTADRDRAAQAPNDARPDFVADDLAAATRHIVAARSVIPAPHVSFGPRQSDRNNVSSPAVSRLAGNR